MRISGQDNMQVYSIYLAGRSIVRLIDSKLDRVRLVKTISRPVIRHFSHMERNNLVDGTEEEGWPILRKCHPNLGSFFQDISDLSAQIPARIPIKRIRSN